MASVVLSQVAQQYLAPQIYSIFGEGAGIGASGALWSMSRSIAGIAGSLAGAAIDRALFGSGQKNISGPRLTDLTVQTSTDGAPLPIVYGTVRIAGNVIWSTGLEETAISHDVGGGSGLGGGGSYTTYSYKTDAAVAICEGIITGIRKIWAGPKLIYDISSSAQISSLIGSVIQADSIKIYTGTETQEVDPLIESIEGVDSTPAYKGIAYIVFENLQLEDFGNALPNFTFEVVKAGHSQTKEVKYDQIDESNINILINDYKGDDYAIYGSKISTTSFNNYIELVSKKHSDNVYNVDKTVYLPVDILTRPANIYSTITRSDICIFPATNTATNTEAYGIIKDGNFIGLLYNNPSHYNGYHSFAYLNGFIYYSNRLGTTLYRSSINSLLSSFTDIINGNIVPYEEFKFHNIEVADNTPTLSVSNNYIWLSLADTNNTDFCMFRFDPNTRSFLKQAYLPNSSLAIAVSDKEILTISGNDRAFMMSKDGGLSYQTYLASTSMSTWGSANGASHFGYKIGDGLFCLVTRSTGTGKRVYLYITMHSIDIDSISLSIVSSDIFNRIDENYDDTELDSLNIRGYTIAQPMIIRGALEPLMSSFNFDIIEEDNSFICKRRTNSSIIENVDLKQVGVIEE